MSGGDLSGDRRMRRDLGAPDGGDSCSAGPRFSTLLLLRKSFHHRTARQTHGSEAVAVRSLVYVYRVTTNNDPKIADVVHVDKNSRRRGWAFPPRAPQVSENLEIWQVNNKHSFSRLTES